MDVDYFLQERTKFIRKYYQQASAPFLEVIRKIDAEEEPYIPPYSEDPEPAFLEEWLEATEMVQITGRACVCLLSNSLQLLFKTWEHNLAITCKEPFKAEFKRGFVQGYMKCLESLPGVDLNDCPIDTALLEQVVLLRNQDQHPDDIWTFRVAHANLDLKKHPSPLFIDEYESRLIDEDERVAGMLGVTAHVGAAQLETAILTVEVFCRWLDSRLENFRYH